MFGYPCSGNILISIQSPFSAFLIKEWWNVDAGQYNMVHDFEQSGLRKMIYDSHVLISRMSVLKERQFIHENEFGGEHNLQPIPPRWMYHFSTGSNRTLMFNKLMNKHVFNDTSSSSEIDNIRHHRFTSKVDALIIHHSLTLNLLDVGDSIERFNYNDSMFLNSVPLPYDSKNRPDLVRAPNRYGTYLLQYNMRRNVSIDAFAYWKFQLEDVRYISDEEFDGLLLGSPVAVRYRTYGHIDALKD